VLIERRSRIPWSGFPSARRNPMATVTWDLGGMITDLSELEDALEGLESTLRSAGESTFADDVLECRQEMSVTRGRLDGDCVRLETIAEALVENLGWDGPIEGHNGYITDENGEAQS